jgi:aspartate carbamoyltransferase regulatory subunit
MTEKELRVKKIKNGTVIDHLPGGSALSILKILGIKKGGKTTVSVAINVPSKKGSNRKDVVKVEDKVLKPEETNKLALLAPNATINIIRNYDVVKKTKVVLPEEIMNTLFCANPNCITNQCEPLTAIFKVESKNPIRIRCKFCERIMDKDLIEEKL